LTFSGVRRGGNMPLIQISANNVTGKATSHFRNVKVAEGSSPDRRPLVNLGGGPRLTPKTSKGVPVFVHDYFGPGRHAKVVSTRAKDLLGDGSRYRKEPPLTGDESVVAEVKNVKFPKLLDVLDDLPPVTVITSVRRERGKVIVAGIAHDNGEIASVQVNGQQATIVLVTPGVVDWRAEITAKPGAAVTALARDRAGNKEKMAHRVLVDFVKQEPLSRETN